MIDRREIIIASLALAATTLAQNSFALNNAKLLEPLSWDEFLRNMHELADMFAQGKIAQNEMEQKGLELIAMLDVDSDSFEEAVGQAYESGNLFWLWQRLIKSERLDGGILNIDKSHIIPLHDHPQATGMVRVISGETEVWQFEKIGDISSPTENAELKLLFHGILGPSDMAKITPKHGNIHALRSVSDECAMLDFFIPPFDKRELLFFEPHNENWFEQETVSCRAIPRVEYINS